MKTLASFIFALFVVASPALADDEPTRNPLPPLEAVEVLGVEEIPFTLAVPASLDSVAAEADTPLGCYRQIKEYQLEIMQYGLIVGIAAGVPMEYGVALGGIGILSRYAGCKIKKARNKNQAE